MPIYVYRCSCGEEYEELQNKPQRIKCVNCGGWAKRVITAPNNFIFTEKKKEIYKQQTGIEINDISDEKKYLQKYGGRFVSKREWEEIREKQINKYKLDIDKNKMKEIMAEEMKKVIENEDERRKIIRKNEEKKAMTKELLKENLENVKI